MSVEAAGLLGRRVLVEDRGADLGSRSAGDALVEGQVGVLAVDRVAHERVERGLEADQHRRRLARPPAAPASAPSRVWPARSHGRSSRGTSAARSRAEHLDVPGAAAEISVIQANSDAGSIMSLATENTRCPTPPSGRADADQLVGRRGRARRRARRPWRGGGACASSRSPGAGERSPRGRGSPSRRSRRGWPRRCGAPARPARRRAAAPWGSCAATSSTCRHALRARRGSRGSSPSSSHALGERRAGDVLDAFHQLDQPVVLVGPGGREARRRSCP